jgi:hypothetical protein
MHINKLLLISFLQFAWPSLDWAQSAHVQQGIVFKAATDLRLSGVQIVDKRTSAATRSNLHGDFSITAFVNDTLEATCDGYTMARFIITDFTDKMVFLEPAYTLPEVTIKGNTLLADLNAAKRGYRKKSVFYTGTPHYYYLLLKPMTFIYENFKSEVIDARKFNKVAKNEMAYYQVAARFTDDMIKRNIRINENELEDFKARYWPTAEQLGRWNDYDLANYVIKSYQNFKKNKNIDMADNK